MVRTLRMSLIELMIMKDDIKTVIEYLGKKGNFQFQSGFDEKNSSDAINPDGDIFEKLKVSLSFFGYNTNLDIKNASIPTAQERDEAKKILLNIEELRKREVDALEEEKRLKSAYDEAVSFANLKVPFEQLEHMSFLSMRIGKIDPSLLDELVFNLGGRAVVVQLGDDKSKILCASSKKGRFSLDSELKKYNFVPLEIPENFKGVPEDVLLSMERELEVASAKLKEIQEERENYGKTHKETILKLSASFSIASQIQTVQNSLESTRMVYRITGWIPESENIAMMKEMDSLTEGRIAIRVFSPMEVPAVVSGREKVPVSVKHGKLVKAFERMIFSYGSPVYGTIDPTPFVAVFFTLLFGIMFGDAGQGLVFLVAGILMALNIIKVGAWNKFAPIFIAIGCTSTIMGLLTGEFFANEEILLPFAHFVKKLCGITDPERLHGPILHMMPSAERVGLMFKFFAFTVGVGFIINSVGLVLNIINNILRGHIGKAIFGKTGLTGAVFFWYVITFAVRIAAFGHVPATADWAIIGIALFLTAFGEPFVRLVEGERPIIQHGFGTLIIEGVVEILEVVSSYLSNSVSFLRVGAFALAHAVLGYIISSMSALAPFPAGILISVAGNAIVIVLEGMIVAIQVIRLQYYEFFSKFFNETGREFKPFCFN